MGAIYLSCTLFHSCPNGVNRAGLKSDAEGISGKINCVCVPLHAHMFYTVPKSDNMAPQSGKSDTGLGFKSHKRNYCFSVQMLKLDSETSDSDLLLDPNIPREVGAQGG